jgi:hypothetical protein
MEVRSDCLTEKTEKCTRQSVLTVERNVKFPSNQTRADQYTAENAMPSEDPREDFKLFD